VWRRASNHLDMTNSLKMKYAIIIGFAHMGLGILLKGLNHFHFGDWSSFLLEFIPQFLFFVSTVGLLAWLIIWKWLTDFGENTASAPSLLEYYIHLPVFILKDTNNELLTNSSLPDVKTIAIGNLFTSHV